MASRFATGFPSFNGVGPIGLGFDGGGRLFVTARDNLYRFGAQGGGADANRVNRSSIGQLAALAFGKGGALYAVRRNTTRRGEIIQLDPTDGTVLRVVASGLPCPTGLAVDPRSGDLFVSSVWCTDRVLRISGRRSTPYVTGVHVDGITFAPDGTMYVAHSADGQGYNISSVTGTGAANPGSRTPLAKVPNADGIAIATTDAVTGRPPFLIVNRTDGTISRVDLQSSGHPTADVMTGGSRGDLVAVGPDGCLYATQTDEVLKLSAPDGSCVAVGLAPTGVPIEPPAAAFVRVVGGASKATSCRTNRSLRVRFRAPGGIRVERARLYVGRRLARTVSGRGLQRGVTVFQLPQTKFTLTIRATTKTGRKVVVRRKYRACAGGRK
jgi:hypothetical protein